MAAARHSLPPVATGASTSGYEVATTTRVFPAPTPLHPPLLVPVARRSCRLRAPSSVWPLWVAVFNAIHTCPQPIRQINKIGPQSHYIDRAKPPSIPLHPLALSDFSEKFQIQILVTANWPRQPTKSKKIGRRLASRNKLQVCSSLGLRENKRFACGASLLPPN